MFISSSGKCVLFLFIWEKYILPKCVVLVKVLIMKRQIIGENRKVSFSAISLGEDIYISYYSRESYFAYFTDEGNIEY